MTRVLAFVPTATQKSWSEVHRHRHRSRRTWSGTNRFGLWWEAWSLERLWPWGTSAHCGRICQSRSGKICLCVSLLKMYLIQTGGKQHPKTDEWMGEILICGKWKPLNHKPNFWLSMCCVWFCISGQKDTQSTEASGWVGIWKTGPSCKYSVISTCELKGIFCWVNSHLIFKWLFCRRGNTTARMRMKTSMRMTLTCRVRTLTPKDESLSGICVSEKTQRK